MSIKQSHTDVSITNESGEQIQTSIDIDDVDLQAFCCPQDGTILELEHKLHGGRFECRKCRSIYGPHEVLLR